MDRLYILQKSYVEDRSDPDGMLLEQEIAYYAKRCCDKMEVRDIETEEDFREVLCNSSGKIIPVGNLPFIRAYLTAAGARDKEMTPIEIPDELLAFAGRQYFILSGTDLLKTEYVKGGYFVKDATELKSWNSLLYDGDISSYIIPPHRYAVSEKLEIWSEYRVFVLKDTAIDIKHYAGNPFIFPDAVTISRMIKAYENGKRPEAYTLDVAVIHKDGKKKTVPMEVHPFVSCGLYGFQGKEILDMLELGIKWYLE